jgi:hypothetical protein
MSPEARRAPAPVLVLALLAAAGCTGARHLADGHLAYNEAVRTASDQELLLNIVRMRYLDSLEFLATTSINSTLSFSIGLDASASRSGGDTSGGAGVSARWSATPTFSFVPQRGGDVARLLTDPVDVSMLVALTSAHRDAHQIFRLAVSWMNGLDNQEGRIDPRFVEVTRRLTELQFAGKALIGFHDETVAVSPPMASDQLSPSVILQALGAGLGLQVVDGGERVVFTRTRRRATLRVAADAPERLTLLEALRLDPERTEWPVEPGAELPADGFVDALYLRTRSLLHGLAFLSQGIEIPFDHLAAGVAAEIWPHASIDPVAMDDIFRVHSAASRPEGASVAVRHRGRWFYLRDDDEPSKRTFFLITEAFRLTLEHDSRAAPVLTLPVGP